MSVKKLMNQLKDILAKAFIKKVMSISEYEHFILETITPPLPPVFPNLEKETKKYIERYKTLFYSLRDFLPYDFLEYQETGFYYIPIGLFDGVSCSKFHNASSMFELGDKEKGWSTKEIWTSFKNEKLTSNVDNKECALEAYYILFERGILGGRLIYNNSGGSHRFASLWRRHLFKGEVIKVPAKLITVKLKRELISWIESGGLVVIGDDLEYFCKINLPEGSWGAIDRNGIPVFLLIEGDLKAWYAISRACMENRCVILNDTLLTAYTIQQSNITTLPKVLNELTEINTSYEKIKVCG